jgi:LEA14-like dessication related protein
MGSRLTWLLTFSLMLSGCSLLTPKFERPTVSVIAVQVVHANLFEQTIRLTLSVHNPNDRVLPVRRLTADLRTDGEEIATGESDAAFDVPARGDASFTISIKANMAIVLLQIANHRRDHTDAINYDVTGVVSLDLPFLRSLSFRQSGSFSLADYLG